MSLGRCRRDSSPALSGIRLEIAGGGVIVLLLSGGIKNRRAAAIRTGTPVTVQVVGPEAFPMGSGGWQSASEVINATVGLKPDRIQNRGRR
jgi:hypothetical protein